MGGFIIVDIGFKTIKDRKKFENLYKKRYDLKVLVDENSNSLGFGAWETMRKPCVDVVYFMGFAGFVEMYDVIKECKKKKIGIKFFAQIPINNRNAHWEKLVGKW